LRRILLSLQMLILLASPLILGGSSGSQAQGLAPWWKTTTVIGEFGPESVYGVFSQNQSGLGPVAQWYGMEFGHNAAGGQSPPDAGVRTRIIDAVHMTGGRSGAWVNYYIASGAAGQFRMYYNQLSTADKWRFPNGTIMEDAIEGGSGRLFNGSLLGNKDPMYPGEVYFDPSNPYWLNFTEKRILSAIDSGVDAIYQDNLVISPLNIQGDFGYPGSWFDYNFDKFLSAKFSAVELASMGIDPSGFRFANYLASHYVVQGIDPTGVVSFQNIAQVRQDPIVKDWLLFQHMAQVNFTCSVYAAINQRATSLGKSIPYYGNMGTGGDIYTAQALSLLPCQDVIGIESSERAFYPPYGSRLLGVGVALAGGNYTKPIWNFANYPPGFYPWTQSAHLQGQHWVGPFPADLSTLFQLQVASGFASGSINMLSFYTGLNQSTSAGERLLFGNERYTILPFVSFTRDMKSLLLNNQPAAKVALIWSQPSFYWNYIPAFGVWPDEQDDVQGWSHLLESHHVPYDVVIFGEPGLFNDSQQLARLGQYDLVVLPNVEVLSNAQIQSLQEYLAHGGRLIISGNFGGYDTNYDLRSLDDAGLRRITSSSQWILEPVGAEYWNDLVKGADASAVESRMWSVLKSSLLSPQLETNAPPRVLVNVVSQPSIGRQLVHLVNMQYGANLTRDWVTDVANVTVSLKTNPNLLARGVFLVTPESNEPIPLSVTQEGGYARFTVPHLHVWAIVVIGMSPSEYDVMRDAGHVLFTQLPPLLGSSGATAAVGLAVNSAILSYWNGDYDEALRLGTEALQEIVTQAAKTLALHDQASQMLASVGSNLTAIERTALQSSEAKDLLKQSLDEYTAAVHCSWSKNYTGVLQHGQKALDLIQQAQLRESQYHQQQQHQQLLTRTAEIAVAVVVPVAGACVAVYYLRKRKRSVNHLNRI
jgi:hypothetical protein